MWAPIAAIVLVMGIVNTPSMIEAERRYLEGQEPVIEVEKIQAAEAGTASEAGEEVN